MARRFRNPWIRVALWIVILVVPGGMVLLGVLAADKLRPRRTVCYATSRQRDRALPAEVVDGESQAMLQLKKTSA